LENKDELPEWVNGKLLDSLGRKGFNSRLSRDSLGRWKLKVWKRTAEDLAPIDFSEVDKEIKEILAKKR